MVYGVAAVEEDKAPMILQILEVGPECVGGNPMPSCTMEENGGQVEAG